MTDSIPTRVDHEALLIDTAVEGWRFSRLFLRVAAKLDAGDATRYANQLRFFQRRLEENLEAAGFSLVDVEGRPYDPGIAASALNIGDFSPDDDLLVDQMVEPIIMSQDGIKRTGTVTVRRASK
jgi:hypothetical protein